LSSHQDSRLTWMASVPVGLLGVTRLYDDLQPSLLSADAKSYLINFRANAVARRLALYS